MHAAETLRIGWGTLYGNRVTEKPTIFFSHSARDSELLNAIKNAFCSRTGGSIDVFLSSDGSSIPFGHNWQRTIEEALSRTRLMFVFLSPISVNSKWIYFESGFAYAKNVQVVPVALEGIELDTQPPPLQLLNGFNMRSHEGLNNLISIANKVLNHHHVLSFQASDYADLVCKTDLGPRRALGSHADLVEHLNLTISCREPQDELEWTERYANTPNAPVSRYDGQVELFGLRILAREQSVTFSIDRLAVDRVYPTLDSLLASAMPVGSACSVTVWYGSNVYQLGNDLRRSASLIGTEWAPSGDGYIRQRSAESSVLRFEIQWHEAQYPEDDEGVYLVVTKTEGIPSLSDLRDTLDLCFDRRILTERSRAATRT